MGSVSSLISGHSFHSKHCRASEYKVKKTSKKSSRGADGLLRYGFSQDSTNNTTKAISKLGKSEDFFYIKLSHKTRVPHKSEGAKPSVGEEEKKTQAGMEAVGSTPPKLVPFSGKLEKGTEKGLIRPTAFKLVIPRNSNSTVHNSMESHNNLKQVQNSKQLSPSEKLKDQDQKQANHSGTLSDSGRNSMSSIPTHSTTGSCQTDNLSTSAGLPNRFGGSAQNMNQTSSAGVPNDSNIVSLKVMSLSDSGQSSPGQSGPSSGQVDHCSENVTCVRSPISTDEALILKLEQKLLEKDSELQDLQVSLEEKETDTCQLFEEKQKYCKEEMEGLKQRCSSKLRQVSQKAVRAQQVMQLQVFQLQQEKKKLQDDLNQLAQERDLLEVKLKSYEKGQTQMAPTLEETQWEVCQKSGEISLLKQQLKESQGDVSHKLNEIVSLKALLKETKAKIEPMEQKVREMEESVHTRTMEVEVCENELQRKKNEADLLREKVGQLETDIRNLKQDLALVKEELNKQEASGRRATGQAKCLSTAVHEMETLQKEVERLKAELKEERQKKEKMVSSFQHERLIWNREKEKVIKYQKQLQHNYLQVHKKNQDLEKILKELTVELESRTELDINVQSADIQYDKIIATEI
ncbi:leucine zipper putative tumor suppressor 1-like [Huso huso]|uniref:Leucine zipper putative tumor suppressor 1-like n=1 Tax=Huso huso TaxID=61971 RepID=A0ABR0Y7V2_HUSHU